jgi:hypothetical protein
MATAWEHQVFVICHSAAIGGAIQALDIAFPRDDGQPRNPAMPEQVGCRLTGAGGTYYGAAFSVTEPIRVTLEGLGLANVPGVTYWRCRNPSGLLATTNHPSSVPSIGQPWGWQQCLTAQGLTQG